MTVPLDIVEGSEVLMCSNCCYHGVKNKDDEKMSYCPQCSENTEDTKAPRIVKKNGEVTEINYEGKNVITEENINLVEGSDYNIEINGYKPIRITWNNDLLYVKLVDNNDIEMSVNLKKI